MTCLGRRKHWPTSPAIMSPIILIMDIELCMLFADSKDFIAVNQPNLEFFSRALGGMVAILVIAAAPHVILTFLLSLIPSM